MSKATKNPSGLTKHDLFSYIIAEASWLAINSTQRRGQALWNVASTYLDVEHLRATEFDPFNDDEKIDSFLIKIYECKVK